MVQQSQTQRPNHNKIDKTVVISEGIAALKEVLMAGIAAHSANTEMLMNGMTGEEKIELVKIQSNTALELMRMMSEQFAALQAMEERAREERRKE